MYECGKRIKLGDYKSDEMLVQESKECDGGQISTWGS